MGSLVFKVLDGGDMNGVANAYYDDFRQKYFPTQPSWVDSGCSRPYLLSFLLVASMGKWSLQYVKDLEF